MVRLVHSSPALFPKQFTVRGSQFFLKMCPVTAGVRPFSLAMQHFYSVVSRSFPLAMRHFYSFVSHVISLLLFPRFGACTASVLPFPLAMQHFYSLTFVCQVIFLKQVTGVLNAF